MGVMPVQDKDSGDEAAYEAAYEERLSALMAGRQYKADVGWLVRNRAIELAEQKGSKFQLDAIKNAKAKNVLATVRGWYGEKHQIPGNKYPFLREALIDLVENNVSPSEVSNLRDVPFGQVIQELEFFRNKKRKPGLRKVIDSSALFEAGALLVPAANGKNLDQKSLFMGSWVINGEIPPYSPREIDSIVLGALNDSESQLVVISGKPKSGKTRTLIENLAQSTHANSTYYWVSPRPGAIDRVIQTLSPAQKSDTVIVLDDLQRFSFDVIYGLTPERLNALQERGLVVGTVHDAVIDEWNYQQIHHSNQGFSAPAQQVLEKLQDNQINQTSSLTDLEAKNASTVFGGLNLLSPDYEYLPAWLASVKALEMKLKRLCNSNRLGAATLAAIIDARILYSSGITFEDLESIARRHFQKLNPYSPWPRVLWEQYLVELTEGVVDGSRHAILLPVSSDNKYFVLMDALWDLVKPSMWEPTFVADPDLSTKEIAWLAYKAELSNSSEQILLRGVDSGDLDCAGALGNLFFLRGKLDDAITWFQRASENGDTKSFNQLGYLLERTGNQSEANYWYKLAAESGEPLGMTNHGYQCEVSGDLKSAEFWYRKAIDSEQSAESIGKTSPLHLLANLLHNSGRKSEAITAMTEAASAGNARAQNGLGLWKVEDGDYSGAKLHFQEATEADISDPNFEQEPAKAMNSLGVIALQEDDLEQAKYWFEKGLEINPEKLADEDKALILDGLAYIYSQQGNHKKSEKLYEEAADLGHPSALNDRACEFIENGEPIKAIEVLRSALSSELLDDRFVETRQRLSFNLGNQLAFQGQFEEAEKWLRHSIESINEIDSLESTFPFFRLGLLLEMNGGEESEIRELFECAALHGNDDAIQHLASLSDPLAE